MNELKIVSKTKWLINYFEIYIFSTIPKSLLVIRFKIEENLYSLIENISKANINKGNLRNKYQKEILFNISMIDFYIGLLLDKSIIKKRKFNSVINAINEIRMMTYGWISSEKKE